MEKAASLAETARKDLWIAAALLAITALGFASLLRNAALWAADFGADPGPAFLPVLLLSVLGLCALGLGAVGAVRLIGAGAWPVAPVRREACQAFAIPVLMIATLLIFVRAMPAAGFIPATVAFALFWMIIIGVQEDGRPGTGAIARYLAEAAAITGVIYVVFAKLILVVLP